jgi:3-hydroxyacyl-CoA dehydrogenase
LVGRTEEKCIQTRSKISAGIARSAKRKFANDLEAQQEYVTKALSHLEMRSDVLDANLQDADLIIEAIVEDLKVKQSFFEKIESAVNE